MPGVLSVDLRWRIVTCSTVDGLTNARLARRFMVSQRSVRRVMERFHADGDVVRKSRRSRRGRITWLTRDLKEELIKIVVDSPHALLKDNFALFSARTGVDVDISTFCRAVSDCGFTRKKLRAYARQRDRLLSQEFRARIASRFDPEMLFFLDETAKDRDALRRQMGYALRGYTPEDPHGYAPRSYRCSSLCGMDVGYSESG